MLPEFLDAIAEHIPIVTSSPGYYYYITGTHAINRALFQRGARLIPTDDIDVKFMPSADLGSILKPSLMSAWRDIVQTWIVEEMEPRGFQNLV